MPTSDAADDPRDLPLAGFRVGVTAARKVDEQVALLERRGATAIWAPVLSTTPNRVADAGLRKQTEEVLARPVDLFLATTGIGMKAWLAAADGWGVQQRLLERIGGAEILARGPKSVGALRRFGLREAWSPESEELDDVLAHLDGRDLTGLRVVVQEHGQSLSTVVETLERRGADVTGVAIYRVVPTDDLAPVLGLLDDVVARRVDAVTFTSAPAVAALMDVAESAGRAEEVAQALRTDVLASSVGPVTAAAFEVWDVPSVHPDRSRLAAMVRQLETALPAHHRRS